MWLMRPAGGGWQQAGLVDSNHSDRKSTANFGHILVLIPLRSPPYFHEKFHEKESNQVVLPGAMALMECHLLSSAAY